MMEIYGKNKTFSLKFEILSGPLKKLQVEKFRGNLISRMPKIPLFRGNLISRKNQKLRNLRKLVPAKISSFKVHISRQNTHPPTTPYPSIVNLFITETFGATNFRLQGCPKVWFVAPKI